MTTKRTGYAWTMRVLMWLAAGTTAALTVFVVGYVLIQGIPNLSWAFINTKPSYLSGNIGILPDILNTVQHHGARLRLQSAAGERTAITVIF